MLEELLRIFQLNPAATMSAIVASLALIVSIGAFVLSWKSRTATLYSDIDARYMELLKLSINNSDFVNPDITNDYINYFKDKKKELLAYEQYAYAAWNIVETIVDRRRKWQLRKTWYPVIAEENSLHRAWLNEPENHHKFKNEFLKFMLKHNRLFPCQKSKEGEERCLCEKCNDLRALVESKR
jgi:hypothetical protein